MEYSNFEKKIAAARERLVIAEKDYTDAAVILGVNNSPPAVRDYILSVKQSVIDQEKQIIETFTWAISKK